MIIEVCRNAEWWRVFGPLGFCEDDDEALSVVGDIRDAIEAAGFETTNAKGQRMLLHGWNGANTFVHKYGGIGTFSELSDDEWDRVVAAYDAVIKTSADARR